jgi:orotidine-5'-phosphate decarboxylase
MAMMLETNRKGTPDVTFVEKLRASVATRSTLLCIGLDPELARLPDHLPRTVEGVAQFNREIIAATSDLVSAYKPNLAFYEALGPDGLRVLANTIREISQDIVVIGDAKRGDVGNTARAYASALFDWYGFDAVTVSPYLGGDAIEPFLAYSDRGVFVLCRTSNPGAGEIQSLNVPHDGQMRPLYEVVALRARTWNARGNIGLVVGATAPSELTRVRELAPDLPILIPGIGAQAGDVASAVRAHREDAPVVISASRSILYASSGPDFAEAARQAALALHDALQSATVT